MTYQFNTATHLAYNAASGRYEVLIEDGTRKVSIAAGTYNQEMLAYIRGTRRSAAENGEPCSLAEAKQIAADLLDAQYWIDRENGADVLLLPAHTYRLEIRDERGYELGSDKWEGSAAGAMADAVRWLAEARTVCGATEILVIDTETDECLYQGDFSEREEAEAAS